MQGYFESKFNKDGTHEPLGEKDFPCGQYKLYPNI